MMHVDKYNQRVYSEADLCSLLMQEPNRVISECIVDFASYFDPCLELRNVPKLTKYIDPKIPVDEFDSLQQSQWYMPKEYQELDIAKWVLEQCKTEESLQRAGQELLAYSDRNMFPMLQYLKYLVDTMRKHNIVWGVGRGSSVSSYVLYIIGIHHIDSLFYDLSIDEFLK